MTEAPNTLVKRNFSMIWFIFGHKMQVKTMFSENVDPESINVDPESSEMPVNYRVLCKPCSKNASLSDPEIESRKAIFSICLERSPFFVGRVPSHATVPSPVSPVTRFSRKLTAAARFEDGKFMGVYNSCLTTRKAIFSRHPE